MQNSTTVRQIPDGTVTEPHDHPLLGLPDGSVFNVLADPKPTGNPDDSPWEQVAAHINEKTDPKAVRLAHAIQLLHPSEATILFGSRARGNHRPDSDVDILIVATRPPRRDLNIPDLATSIYEHPILVEVVHIDQKQFTKVAKYRNTFVTHALLDGLTVSPTPSRWRSRYAPPNPAKNLYSWEQYENLAYESKFSMDIVLTIHTGKVHGDDAGASYFLHAIKMAELEDDREATVSRMLREYLPKSIRKAMQTAVAATGDLPPKNGTITSLHTTLTKLAPGVDWELSIPPERYDQMVHEEFLDVDQAILVRQGRNDQSKVRKAATQLLRRTKHAAEA